MSHTEKQPNDCPYLNSLNIRPVTSIYRVNTVEIMQEVAPEFGISVTILAEAGEIYKDMETGRIIGTVGEESAYIQINQNPENQDLSPFHQKVNTLLEERRQRQ